MEFQCPLIIKRHDQEMAEFSVASLASSQCTGDDHNVYYTGLWVEIELPKFADAWQKGSTEY